MENLIILELRANPDHSCRIEGTVYDRREIMPQGKGTNGKDICSGPSFRSKIIIHPPKISCPLLCVGMVIWRDKAEINILDVGCGWGNNLSFLKAQGFRYTGIDFFSNGGPPLPRKLTPTSSGARLNAMPLPDGEFDLVFDWMAIQHNRHAEMVQIFREVLRVLKLGWNFLLRLN